MTFVIVLSSYFYYGNKEKHLLVMGDPIADDILEHIAHELGIVLVQWGGQSHGQTTFDNLKMAFIQTPPDAIITAGRLTVSVQDGKERFHQMHCGVALQCSRGNYGENEVVEKYGPKTIVVTSDTGDRGKFYEIGVLTDHIRQKRELQDLVDSIKNILSHKK